MIKVETLSMVSKSSIYASILDKSIKTPVQCGLPWPSPCYPYFLLFSSKLSAFSPLLGWPSLEASLEGCSSFTELDSAYGNYYSLKWDPSWEKILCKLLGWCDCFTCNILSWKIAYDGWEMIALYLSYWLRQNEWFIFIAWYTETQDSLTINITVKMIQYFKNENQSGKPKPINSNYFVWTPISIGSLWIMFKQQSQSYGFYSVHNPGLVDLAWK
jgi:hypothetical protein